MAVRHGRNVFPLEKSVQRKKYKQSYVQKAFSAGQDGRLMLLYIGCYPASPSSQICFLSLPLSSTPLPPPPFFHLFLLLLFLPLFLRALLTVCSGGQWHHLEWAALVRCCTHGCWLCHRAGFQSGLRRAEGEVWVALSVGNPEKKLKQRCCCLGTVGSVVW